MTAAEIMNISFMTIFIYSANLVSGDLQISKYTEVLCIHLEIRDHFTNESSGFMHLLDTSKQLLLLDYQDPHFPQLYFIKV